MKTNASRPSRRAADTRLRGRARPGRPPSIAVIFRPPVAAVTYKMSDTDCRWRPTRNPYRRLAARPCRVPRRTLPYADYRAASENIYKGTAGRCRATSQTPSRSSGKRRCAVLGPHPQSLMRSNACTRARGRVSDPVALFGRAQGDRGDERDHRQDGPEDVWVIEETDFEVHAHDAGDQCSWEQDD